MIYYFVEGDKPLGFNQKRRIRVSLWSSCERHHDIGNILLTPPIPRNWGSMGTGEGKRASMQEIIRTFMTSLRRIIVSDRG